MFDIERFKTLAGCTQDELMKLLPKILSAYGYKHICISQNNYIYAKGKINIGLVAHLDTVFANPPTDIFHDPIEHVLWSYQGLGADDRAGIAAILEILDSGLRPWVFFCCGEEGGGIGAKVLAKQCKPNLKYLIEIDRAGIDDCVFYNCDNADFIKYVESFGFKEQLGTFSDIFFLAPKWKCAAVNLSTGYFNEHSHIEFFNYEILENTINKIMLMLTDPDSRKFEYIEKIAGTYCDFCNGHSGTLKPYTIMGTNDKVYLCKSCYQMLKEHLSHD